MTRSRFIASLLLLLVVALLRAQTGDDVKSKKGPPPPEGLKALQHPDAKVRYRAVETLAHLGPLAKFAVPELRETLKDKNALVRVKSAEALWKIDKTPANVLLTVLAEALTDKDAGVRAAAPPVIALLGTKAKAALPALVQTLQDKVFDVKLAAVVALGDLGPLAKETASNLLELTDDKEFFLLEPFVGATLASLGDSVVPVLAKALSNVSADRRRVAAYALGSMGPGAVLALPELSKALHYDDPATRKLAARALGKIGPNAKPSVAQLETRLRDPDVTVRIEAALATWLITGDAKPVAVLVNALSDESASVREIACQTLGTMKAAAKDAVEPVAKLLNDKDLRVRAIMTLGEIGPSSVKALPELRKGLQDKDDEVQLWSAFALWQVTAETKDVLPILERMLGSETHDKQAIDLIGKMGSAAEKSLPTLVAIYREEENASFRLAVGLAIKKIDAKAAQQLGIR